MSAQTVAVLGLGVVPAEAATLRLDDAAVLRGDGAFEATQLRPEGPWLLDRHLDRLAHSAHQLRLPLPPRAALVQLVEQACAAWPGTGEAAIRLVVTRGPEDGSRPGTAFVIVSEVPPGNHRYRRTGVRLARASLQMPAESRAEAPWLLPGVKSLSYAANLAATRWALEQGADDVLWTSSDGYALEAPTSNLLWLTGDRLGTVPADRTGILAGVTAGFLLESAHRAGLSPGAELIRASDLYHADAVWLTSSIRGIIEVRSLDGVPLSTSAMTATLRELAGFPVGTNR
jgi:4-amino-4-deoxychorismate lyase